MSTRILARSQHGLGRLMHGEACRWEIRYTAMLSSSRSRVCIFPSTSPLWRRHGSNARQQSTSTFPPRNRRQGQSIPARRRSTTAELVAWIKRQFRDRPARVLFVVVLGGFGLSLVYIAHYYLTYIMSEQFTRYPEPIANSLRRALYYSNINPDPAYARKYYYEALEQCKEFGLDHFSDEVLGIKIQVSQWLEQTGDYETAIQLLTKVLGECLAWIDKFDKGIADGTVPESGEFVPPPRPGGEDARPNGERSDAGEEVELENLWHRRTRLLSKAVGTSLKLGDLYANEHVMEPEESQARLAWAVETSLKELARRAKEGAKEVEGPWLSREEIGASMEALGRQYEANSQFRLAVPLFFHALRLCDVPCHRPVLMNNLAVSFSQHPPLPALQAPLEGGGSREAEAGPDVSAATPTSRRDHLESALNWSVNAYQHAKDVRADERTAECDEACAVALCNMGDVLAMLGRPVEARRRFEQCIEMSKAVDFPDGVGRAQAGLAQVSKGQQSPQG